MSYYEFTSIFHDDVLIHEDVPTVNMAIAVPVNQVRQAATKFQQLENIKDKADQKEEQNKKKEENNKSKLNEPVPTVPVES